MSPTRSQKERTEVGVNPLRRIPLKAGIRGSSHPSTCPSSTSLSIFLAHYSVVEIQSGKFNLLGVVDLQILAKPIIQRAVMFKFQCAKRMSDPLE